ncbi:MAG: outer membrane lipoprotein-sorting protein [Treponema sp.]|nr:outer membrane lipoprotein-sorting protein [Treponema sp.]
MKRKTVLTLALIVLCVRSFSQDADEILKKVDERRAVGSSFSFTLKVDDYSKGILSDSAVMNGHAKGMDKTMVQYEEPANMKGKKLLMVRDEMFIFVPKTQRPVRLTPSQRLMGQASNGDVMNVRFQSDYKPELTGDETIETQNGRKNCLILTLTAKRRGSTYNRIVLWVEKETCFPVKADCYALSGKLLKTIEYSLIKEFEGKKIVSKATICDKVTRDTYTVIEFLDMQTDDTPDSYFNKEYLLRMH